MYLLFKFVVITILDTSIRKIKKPFKKNKIHKITSSIVNSGSNPKDFIVCIYAENLSVPTESDIDKFMIGIIIPKPISSIKALTNDRITSKNSP